MSVFETSTIINGILEKNFNIQFKTVNMDKLIGLFINWISCYMNSIFKNLGFILLASIAFNTNLYAKNIFFGKINAIPSDIQKKMIGNSWHEGCPIGLDDLAYLKVSYWGFDNKSHMGEIIIHKSLASETLTIFKELFQIKYPIQEMKLYDDYGVINNIGQFGKHNDTVGFYCRPPANGSSKFSEHAYGIAIDINPLNNPYVKGNIFWPFESKNFIDRSKNQKNMIQVDSKIFRIFTQHGWEWGGLWKNEKDYMHFQKFIVGHYIMKSMDYIPEGSILLSPAIQGV